MTVDINAKDWSVIVKTKGGTVSMLRNLSLREARLTQDSMPPWRAPSGPYFEDSYKGAVEYTSVIGPEGWDGCMAGAAHEFEPSNGDGSFAGKVRTSLNWSCRACRQGATTDIHGKIYVRYPSYPEGRMPVMGGDLFAGVAERIASFRWDGTLREVADDMAEWRANYPAVAK